MEVKCVMLDLVNPSITNIGKKIVDKYFDYINVPKCIENDMNNLYENKPHITLLYGFDPPIGENTMYHILKIQNRDLYKKLKSNTKLILNEIIFDTFDNDDCRVLKINTDNCGIYQTLNDYHLKLNEFPNTHFQAEDGKFHSHITLTYLKADTSDEIIENIKSDFLDEIIPYMEINGFLLSPDTKDTKLLKLT